MNSEIIQIDRQIKKERTNTLDSFFYSGNCYYKFCFYCYIHIYSLKKKPYLSRRICSSARLNNPAMSLQYQASPSSLQVITYLKHDEIQHYGTPHNVLHRCLGPYNLKHVTRYSMDHINRIMKRDIPYLIMDSWYIRIYH